MKYGWDDELMEDDLRVWREWRREAAELDVVKIPRALLSPDKPVREASLQVFSDASQDAYGACAYLRREFKDNAVECRLVAGKGRVAPLKAQSICRLELTGALLAARLAEALTAELMMKIEKIAFWSDSTTVLHWIHQTSSNYKAFVGNRVSEIHTIMSDLDSTLGAGKVCWRYVPTDSNPADEITRGLCPDQLNVNHPYYGGPEFLLKSAKLWPESKVEAPQEEADKSERKLKWAGVSQETEPVFGWRKYSSLTKKTGRVCEAVCK